MKSIAIGVLLSSLCIASAHAEAPAVGAAQGKVEVCKTTSEQEISSLFDRWNASLATRDPDKVVANYAADGVLLPTLSNTPRTNHAEMRDYFVEFLKKEPQGKIDRRIVKLGCNIAQDVGVYTFTLKGGKQVQARYTYVYEFREGRWVIAHHHSSAMPEG